MVSTADNVAPCEHVTVYDACDLAHAGKDCWGVRRFWPPYPGLQLSVQLCPAASEPSDLHVPQSPLDGGWTPWHNFCHDERRSTQNVKSKTRCRFYTNASQGQPRQDFNMDLACHTSQRELFCKTPRKQLGCVPATAYPGMHENLQF